MTNYYIFIISFISYMTSVLHHLQRQIYSLVQVLTDDKS